jgi:4-amino-4-deoxy-L-arabinose transferase-like glycosyltransferase
MSTIVSSMPAGARSDAQTARQVIVTGLVVLVFGMLWFAALGYRDLAEPDEGRYAEIPREMLATSDWVTPHLDGLKYFEKPPLQYWATAASFELFGQSNASARLWPALLGFLTVLWVLFVGARLFGPRAGAYAAGMLGTGLSWVAFGHLNTLDMGVSAFLTFAIGALLLAQSERDNATAEGNWMLLGWTLLAAAILSKGLIGVVLPGGAVLLYSLWQRDWALWRHLHLGKGLLVLLVLTAPWFVAVSRANPDFLWFFFVHEHFLRYVTMEAHRVQPWWYFFVLVWVGLLPWLGSGVRAVLRPGFHWRGGQGGFDPARFLWVYGVFVVVFFSMSDSKLVSYILPVYPAFAWLAGRGLAKREPGRADALAAGALGMALVVLAFNLGWFANDKLPLPILSGARPWLLAAGCVLIAGGVATWRLQRGRLWALALAALIGFQCLNWGYQSLSPVYSARNVARAMAPLATPDTPIYSVGIYKQSLPFYLGHTVRLVAYRGEFDFGLRHAPGAEIPNMAAFASLWRRNPKALAVMRVGKYRQLLASGLPMRVIYRDPRRVAVARR